MNVRNMLVNAPPSPPRENRWGCVCGVNLCKRMASYCFNMERSKENKVSLRDGKDRTARPYGKSSKESFCVCPEMAAGFALYTLDPCFAVPDPPFLAYLALVEPFPLVCEHGADDVAGVLNHHLSGLNGSLAEQPATMDG